MYIKPYTSIVNEYGDELGKISKNSTTEWYVYLYGHCYGEMTKAKLLKFLDRLDLQLL